ncbi:hypothetical protein [Actinoplanes sp. N902-109]|uniref:hypothetical protein n=1 Tax=Actinoplanes sp. (strain N902-109) TaxID=649831 RepID=UPI00032960FD|nr:hypothetical protein [Actinoplanes sp. N902-109]AGL20939.1 hypothetical protein L083_7429 [Actinoplanes sp. N902-109]
MTITQAQIDSYRASWFPPGQSAGERSRRLVPFWRALGSPNLVASVRDERAELFRRVLNARSSEFRARTNPLQADISRAIDDALSVQARRARAELGAVLAAGDRARAAANRALTASLDAAIQRHQAAEDRSLITSLGQAAQRAHKRSLTPVGPIRIPVRLP